MPYRRFQEMVEAEKLFVPNSSLFEDPYDCMLLNGGMNALVDRHFADEGAKWVSSPETLALNQADREAGARMRGIRLGHERMAHIQSVDRDFAARRKALFVSCWHASDYESEAFWKIYAKTKGAAITEPVIAIRVSFNEFRTWLERQPQAFHLGELSYVNPQDKLPEIDPADPVQVAFYKRKYFDYEKEVRAVHYWTDPDPPAGLTPLFPLPELQASVFVDPMATSEAYETVKLFMMPFHKPGDVPVAQSDLNKGRIY